MNVIVITGGSRGIGAAAAIEVAKRGMGVILT
jgi:NAD(P)-dependent dehydrogenase (short-subunit alcohol dehydrogenase family)